MIFTLWVFLEYLLTDDTEWNWTELRRSPLPLPFLTPFPPPGEASPLPFFLPSILSSPSPCSLEFQGFLLLGSLMHRTFLSFGGHAFVE